MLAPMPCPSPLACQLHLSCHTPSPPACKLHLPLRLSTAHSYDIYHPKIVGVLDTDTALSVKTAFSQHFPTSDVYGITQQRLAAASATSKRLLTKDLCQVVCD